MSPDGNGNISSSPEVLLANGSNQMELDKNDKSLAPIPPPYSPSDVLMDLPACQYALELFLNSHMVEAEEYMDQGDPKKERLYFAVGYGLLQCFKALMSFEDDDIFSALQHAKHALVTAQAHRKKPGSFASRLAGYVTYQFGSGVGHVKSMTPSERHAELCYAESLFEKALLGIVYSGDWLAFLKEALNLRTCVSVYRSLLAYLQDADKQGEDASIDRHFRSGVYLGNGGLNLVLSLMPGKLRVLAELIGYHGDRQVGLDLLMKSGGWSRDINVSEPTVSKEEEGVRRPICDIALIIFHLVIASFTFDCVDISVAQKVLDWNLARFPNGVFFLFGAGRLSLNRSQPAKAIEYYTHALSAQKQYRNLHHISHWEMAIANFALCDLRTSLKWWKELKKDATWSKACYAYGMAVCLIDLREEGSEAEQRELMESVPGLRQKIAGKSIPLEKFVARKAKKYVLQKGRLALPSLELAYIWLGIAHAPREVIKEKMLPPIAATLAKLAEYETNPSGYYKDSGGGYYDDLCLAKFLEGVCCRYYAYPDPDSVVDEQCVREGQEEYAKRSRKAFEEVFKYGPKIELDHHLVYHAHYELGRLLARSGDKAVARLELELVLSGKPLEVNKALQGKGKYSMEQALVMRTHAAMDALEKDRLL